MKKNTSRFFAIPLMIITLIFTLSGCVVVPRNGSGNAYDQSAVTVKDILRYANVRANPDIYAPIITRAPGGTALYTVGEERNGWIPVSLDNGTYGWISAELVE